MPNIPIPSYLRVDAAKLAEIEQEQALYAQVLNTRAEASELERRLARGRMIEEIARTNLELLLKKRHREPNPDQRALEYNRLAEGLALQGRYHEAVRYVRDPNLRNDFHRIIKALKRDDAEKCDCPHDVLKDESGVEISTSPRFIQNYIVSLPHGGRLMPLILCAKCGHSNIREADGQAARLVPLQNAAAQSAKMGQHDIPQHHARVVLRKVTQ